MGQGGSFCCRPRDSELKQPYLEINPLSRFSKSSLIDMAFFNNSLIFCSPASGISRDHEADPVLQQHGIIHKYGKL